MSAELLETRFFIPPLCPGHIPRPQLISRLNEGLYRKLTLISAPAGFGKTAIVSEWAQNPGNADFLWLSLDERENNPVSFLIYLIHAVRRGRSASQLFGDEVIGMLQSPGQYQMTGILTVLLNGLSELETRTVLILDDYHTLMTPEIDDILNFIITNLPPDFHLVIITREDPDIPFARLRAGDMMTELRAADLKFSLDETTAFLTSIEGIKLENAEIDALDSRTEGWVTGLRLAAFSLRKQADPSSFIESFTGSHRMVLDYLVEEVFNTLDESIKSFLLHTSILDRLSGSLCDFVTGQTNSQQKLELLEKSNLFIISLDNDRGWYRYHHLFRDLLQQKFRHEQKEKTRESYLKAAGWCSENGFTDEAIDYALSSKSYEDAADVLVNNIDGLFQRGEYAKMLRWTGTIPLQIIQKKPLLCLVYSWILFASGRHEEAEVNMKAVINTAEKGFDGRLATIRASMMIYKGDIEKTRELADFALANLPEADILWRGIAAGVLGDLHGFTGNINEALRARRMALEISKTASAGHPVIMSSIKVAITLREKGLLNEALEICLDQIETAEKMGLSSSRVAGWARAVAGEILVEQKKIQEGIKLISEGVELTEKSMDLSIIGWTYHCQLRALFTTGNTAEVVEVLAKINRIAIKSRIPPWLAVYADFWQIRIDLINGRQDKAELWLKQNPLFKDGCLTSICEPDFFSVLQYITASRVLIKSERFEEALSLLDNILNIIVDAGRGSREIEVLILMSVTYGEMGDHENAMLTLGKALSLSKVLGFIMVFADEGPQVGRLLYEASLREVEGQWARQILSAFPVSEIKPHHNRGQNISVHPLVEPLSDRELDVLSLMSEGLKNEQIGERLFISFHTVKVHTRNIFSKLDVHNRTEAVAKARSIGIID